MKEIVQDAFLIGWPMVFEQTLHHENEITTALIALLKLDGGDNGGRRLQ